jgi:hypothetical protein
MDNSGAEMEMGNENEYAEFVACEAQSNSIAEFAAAAALNRFFFNFSKSRFSAYVKQRLFTSVICLASVVS